MGQRRRGDKKQSYKEEVDLSQTPEFRLKLQRTNEGFVTAWAPAGSDAWVSQSVPRANLISVQNQDCYYVGFFASRNAKITVTDAALTTSVAETVASKPWQPKALPPVVQIASPGKSTSEDYQVQARANYDGVFRLRQNEVVIGNDKSVKAGEMYSVPAKLSDNNAFDLTFTPASGEPVQQKFTVEKVAGITATTLHVSRKGKRRVRERSLHRWI